MEVKPENIPLEMKATRRWVLWKSDPVLVNGKPKLKDGKPQLTKMPYSVLKEGQKADSTDPSTWCSFDEAVGRYNRGGYDAVTGTKGYRWKEYSVIRDNGLSSEIDRQYYERLADDAIDTIEQYGSYEWLIDESSPYSSPNPASNDLMKELAA